MHIGYNNVGITSANFGRGRLFDPLNSQLPVIDTYFMDNTPENLVMETRRNNYYDYFRSLRPGSLSEVLLHLAMDDEEV